MIKEQANDYARWWRRNNPDRVRWYRRKPVDGATTRRRMLTQRTNRRVIIRMLVNEAKDKPCVDCGLELPPELMDLDHSLGVKLYKRFRWNSLTVNQAVKELAKCEPRCPLCHRIRHLCED